MRQRGASPGPTPPTPTSQFEVWADEDCTVRPQVGQSYLKLYVKSNITFSQGDPDIEFNPSGSECEKMNVGYSEIDDPPFYCSVYVDFNWSSINGFTPGDVLELVTNEPKTLFAPLVVDFGEL